MVQLLRIINHESSRSNSSRLIICFVICACVDFFYRVCCHFISDQCSPPLHSILLAVVFCPSLKLGLDFKLSLFYLSSALSKISWQLEYTARLGGVYRRLGRIKPHRWPPRRNATACSGGADGDRLSDSTSHLHKDTNETLYRVLRQIKALFFVEFFIFVNYRLIPLT